MRILTEETKEDNSKAKVKEGFVIVQGRNVVQVAESCSPSSTLLQLQWHGFLPTFPLCESPVCCVFRPGEQFARTVVSFAWRVSVPTCSSQLQPSKSSFLFKLHLSLGFTLHAQPDLLLNAMPWNSQRMLGDTFKIYHPTALTTLNAYMPIEFWPVS